jgi:hypothetical protein
MNNLYQQSSHEVLFSDDEYSYEVRPEFENSGYAQSEFSNPGFTQVTQQRRVDPLYLDQKSPTSELEPIIQCSLSLCENLQKTIEDGLFSLRSLPNKNQLAKNLLSHDSTVSF